MEMKKRRIIWVVVFAAIAIAVGFAVARHFKEKSTISACTKLENDYKPSLEKNQVLYIQHCFIPRPLTINKGDSVIFTDKMDAEMWIASDPKPENQYVRQFNSGQAWGNGQSYGFQFDKPGTYFFHNEKTPADRGTIIVK